MKTFNFLVLIILSMMISSCNNDTSSASSPSDEIDNINIRLYKDPQQLNPFFASSSVAREVFQYIFVPLADYHHENLKLSPILIKEVPVGQLEEINGTDCISFTMELRPEATWSDGHPITNKDLDFTYKMVNHALSNASGWSTYFTELKSLQADPTNDRKYTISFDKDYLLALDASVTVNIMPAHMYDTEGIVSNMTLEQIQASTVEDSDSTLVNLFEKINSAVNNDRLSRVS